MGQNVFGVNRYRSEPGGLGASTRSRAVSPYLCRAAGGLTRHPLGGDTHAEMTTCGSSRTLFHSFIKRNELLNDSDTSGDHRLRASLSLPPVTSFSLLA